MSNFVNLTAGESGVVTRTPTSRKQSERISDAGPDQRRGAVPAAASYLPDQAVWVWVWAYYQWLPGEVERSSALSIGVVYRLPGGGIAHDEVMPENLAVRSADTAQIGTAARTAA